MIILPARCGQCTGRAAVYNMKVPFIDLKVQYQTIKQEISEAINNVLDNAHYILGPAVAEFENSWSSFLNIKSAVAVSSGTDALFVALKSLNIGANDEVIIPANTFIATAEAVSLVGAIPVLGDIDETTYNLDINKIEEKITSRTKAIIPVHLYGQAAEMDAIIAIARQHNLYVIEDASQAHGAEYKGKKLGTLGDLGCFSFYPGKNLGAYGEGGAVVTDNQVLAEKIYKIRDHGSNKKYHHDIIGGNFRMSGIQGAVLGVKLKYLESWNKDRRAHAKKYNSILKDVKGIVLLAEPRYSQGNYHLYVIKADKRDELQLYLAEQEIQTGIHYPVPIHLQPAYAFLNEPPGSFPAAERAANSILSLPMYPELDDNQIEYVCEKIKFFISQNLTSKNLV